MDEFVAQVVDVVFTTGGSKVALRVLINLEVSILGRDQHVGPNVKLASMNKQRVMNVLLKNTGALLVLSRISYDLLYFFKFLGDLDSMTSISVLTRLDDPYILLRMS